jgi:signal transduction histidine kinase
MKRLSSDSLFSSRWATGLAAVALWTLIGLFFATAGGELRRVLITWYTWGVLAWLIVLVDRRLPVGRDQLTRRLLWHIPLSLIFSTLYLCINSVINAVLMGSFPDTRLFSALGMAIRNGGVHWNVLIYWLILGAHLALDYRRESQERKQRSSELERLLAEARLSTLRIQLNPHFLFNALNTVSAYVESEPKLARRMLGHLGDLLRMSLDRADRQEVMLAEEMEFLEQYLAIQRVRFQDRLQVNLDIAPQLFAAQVPSLLLQPLVENAITHGLAEKPGVGEVSISAHPIDSRLLRIVVRDNGVGLSAGWRWERDAGIGLTNTRARLDALHGPDQSLIIRNTGEGVIVEVTLPFRVSAAMDNGRIHAEGTRASR